jgi:uncharacterized protein
MCFMYYGRDIVMRNFYRNNLLIPLIVVGCSNLVACANNPLRSYKADTDTPVQQVQQGQLKPAISSLTTSSNSNDIMLHLELGSLYRMDNNYNDSISNLNFANAYINAWLSSYHNNQAGMIGDTLASGLINDKVIDYQVKDYEKVMLATYQSLNNFSLNNLARARVEVMRMYQIEDRIKNYREQDYAKATPSSGKGASTTTPQNLPNYTDFQSKNVGGYNFDFINQPALLNLKNSYENAFSHYLAGFTFEALGEYSLAAPGYKRALELSPGNHLAKDSLHNINYDKMAIRPDSTTTDLLLVEEVGHAPQLQSKSFSIPWISAQSNNCIRVLKVSLPMAVVDNNDKAGLVKIDDRVISQPILFTDINLMLARYLHDNLPNIFMTNLLHVARDYALQTASCNAGGSSSAPLYGTNLSDLAVIGIGQILDSSDERTWVMLPGKIYASRIRLKRGVHSLKVISGANNTVTTLPLNLTKPYQIISFRVMGNSVYISQ